MTGRSTSSHPSALWTPGRSVAVRQSPVWVKTKSDGLEVAVVGRLLLRPVYRTLRAVDIERHAAARWPRGFVLHQIRIEAREAAIVPLFREDLGFEPVERRGERHARLPPLARGQHPKRRVLSQSLGVVRVVVPGQATVDRLAEEVRQQELAIVSRAGIAEVSLDQRTQAEAFVQLARE